MKRKQYVVIENNWEYNDEIFHAGNNGNEGTGRPRGVFNSLKKAEAYARTKSIEMLKDDCNLGGFGYSISDVTDREDELLEILGLSKAEEFDWDYSVPEGISDETAEQILDCLNILFYEVVEVNNED